MDFTAAFTRLLSDRELRRDFRADREDLVRRFALTEEHARLLRSLDPEELDAQARTLVRKRYHEVSKLLPETCRRLARAEERFLSFAESFWPEGHRRHVEDAVRFGEHLLVTTGHPCRSEHNWARFVLEAGRLAVHFVKDLPVDGRRRRAIQILYRKRDGRPHQIAVCARF